MDAAAILYERASSLPDRQGHISPGIISGIPTSDLNLIMRNSIRNFQLDCISDDVARQCKVYTVT